MLGLKRFVRPAVVFSVVLHVSLVLALLTVHTGGVRSAPQPIAVEIVRSDEVPQIEQPHVEGTPLDSTSNGSEMSSDSKKGSAHMAPPRPKLSAPVQQSQERMSPHGGGKPAAGQPKAVPPPGEGETAPQASEALAPPAPSPQPRPDEAPDQHSLNAGDTFGMPLVLPGGRISTGLDAPASHPAMLPHDDTAAFRARLGSCSHLPEWVARDNDAAILLRLSFKRDGTLASPPQLLRSSLSAGAVALMNAAVDALQKCQPFTELPADKYKTWKTLDLVVTPFSLSGR